MAKIGLYFDTDTGNTRKVAKMIRKFFNEDDVELKNISKVEPADFEKFSAYIVGTPTLGDGELPETLAEFLPSLDGMDLSGKTFALFGLGDQETYADEFVDGLGLLFEKLESLGGNFIGQWPTEGYDYKFSRAVVKEGEFVGLVLDQDNQSDLTDERVETWVAAIKEPLLKVAEAMEATA
ncbi:MAG: flavodoxin [Gammaproteobacteria bacterium]